MNTGIAGIPEMRSYQSGHGRSVSSQNAGIAGLSAGIAGVTAGTQASTSIFAQEVCECVCVCVPQCLCVKEI
jgi:hypothetical protein